MSEENKNRRLSLPVRRAIACAGIVIFLIVYIIFVTGLAGRIEGGKLTAFIFYALAGTLWGVPLIPLIAWSENYKWRRRK